MVTLDERITILETEFRTELKHLATKADLADLRGELRADMRSLEHRLTLRLGGLMLAGFGILIAILRLWQ